jgi:hypothetical protein
VLGHPVQGGGEIHFDGRLPDVGDYGDGDLPQIWVECSEAYLHLDFGGCDVLLAMSLIPC